MANKYKTGSSGFRTGSSLYGPLQKVNFPENKRDLEAMIINIFISSLDPRAKRGWGIESIKQNEDECDLDCTVTQVNGDKRDMDLIMHLPPQFKGNFDEMSHRYTIGDYVDKLLAEVEKKSKKYAGLKNPWLLIYITDQKLGFATPVIKLLEIELQKRNTKFEVIFIMTVITENAGKVVQLYPVSIGSITMDIQQVREMTVALDGFP